MTSASFSDVKDGNESEKSMPMVDLDNLAPNIEEKRVIIKYLLVHNFPIQSFLFFVIVFILIGVVAIILEVVLIVNGAVNYKLANGIWAGIFSIINGLSKLILLKTRSYRAHVISQVVAPYQGLTVSVGLTLLSSYNLRRYHCELPDPRCDPPNREVTVAMLILGVFSLVMNISFIFIFFRRLHGGWIKARSQKLGFFQAYRELGHVCNCFRKI